MENKSNLAKAIIAVMQEVKSIDKNMKVGDGNYGYQGVADKDVKQVIGQAMAKNGLCIVPTKVTPTIQIDRWEDSYKKQKQSVMTEVTTEYLLMHESGESMVIAGYGHGVDAQDKAAGKATTYALKYALLYTFMVPTGAIDDTDTVHSEDKEVPKANPKEPTNGKIKPNEKQWAKTIERLKSGEDLDKEQIKAALILTPEQIKELDAI